jgi:HlyD family secretion protein
VLALAVAGAAALGYRHWQTGAVDGSALTLYGNVDLREVELAFVLQERIRAVLVEEGDAVRRGEPLAELDPTRHEAAVAGRSAEVEAALQQLAELERGSRPEEVRRAEAEVAAARAAEREAELSYDRIARLVREKLASPQSRDDALAALDTARARTAVADESLRLVVLGPRDEVIAAARARLRTAEAALAAARKDLEDTRLRAPANGVIRARILEPGDVAGPQRPVFTLALTDPAWVRAYVSGPDLGRIRPGMPAEVRTDSFPGKVYDARIGFISPTAEFTPKTVQTADVRTSLVYQVRVLVPDPAGELRLGMPATVTVPLAGEGEPPGPSPPAGGQ